MESGISVAGISVAVWRANFAIGLAAKRRRAATRGSRMGVIAAELLVG